MRRASCLALIAGTALSLDGPPNEHAVGGLLFAPALFFAVERFVASRDVARAAAIGALAGLAFGLSSFAWVAPALARFDPAGAWLGVPACVAVMLFGALPPLLACVLYVTSARRAADAPAFALSLAVAFTFVPQLFPYRPLALALPWSPVAGLLSLGGATLAEAGLGFVFCSIAGAVLLRRARELAFAVLGLGILLGAGQLETMRLEHARRGAAVIRLGVAQTAVSVEIGRTRERRPDRLDDVRERVRSFAGLGVDAVVLPESAFPYALDRRAHREPVAPRDVGAARHGVSVAIGAGTVGEDCGRWNGVVVFDARGHLVERVDKQRRMPFADASLATLLFAPRRRACGELAAAEETAPLRALGGAGALVCYDEVEALPAMERVERGATDLVGFTNDAWYAGTRQPALHERVARMRALETGRDLVRVVNGGPSSHIAASGRFVRRLPEGGAGGFVAEVRRLEGRPLASWLGVLPVVLGFVVLLVFSAQRRKTSSSGGGR